LASELDLPDETRRLAERLATEAEDRGLANGRNPAGVAAGCLYEAAQELHDEVTQQGLGEAAEVSAVTVRSRWREVRERIATE
jgi:transcription initiation factor TFIIB